MYFKNNLIALLLVQPLTGIAAESLCPGLVDHNEQNHFLLIRHLIIFPQKTQRTLKIGMGLLQHHIGFKQSIMLTLIHWSPVGG